VLFLDEALEFRRPVLQGLREPMERGRIILSRAGRRFWFPADFQLLLAANPCPCGMLGRSDRVCLCSVSEVERYWKRIGGPLLDRIDLRMAVFPESVATASPSDSSETLRSAVRQAFRSQKSRGRIDFNRSLGAVAAREACGLGAVEERLVSRISERFGFSTRATVSLLRVARTIATVEGETRVREEHLFEAAAYRRAGEDEPLWSGSSLDRAG
jgi:magnesium chelatase family protein